MHSNGSLDAPSLRRDGARQHIARGSCVRLELGRVCGRRRASQPGERSLACGAGYYRSGASGQLEGLARLKGSFGFQRASKGLPKGFQGTSRLLPRVSQRASSGFPKGFQRVFPQLERSAFAFVGRRGASHLGRTWLIGFNRVAAFACSRRGGAVRLSGVACLRSGCVRVLAFVGFAMQAASWKFGVALSPGDAGGGAGC